MTTFGRLRKSVTMLMIVLLLGAAPVAAGQSQEFEPEHYTSALTGLDVEVSGPDYAISYVELQHYTDGEGEIIQIDSETRVASLEVSFFDDADTPQESIGIYLRTIETAAEEFELVDRGVHGDYHYALAVIMFDNVELVYFIQVYEDLDGNTDLLEAILTSSLTFEDDLVQAKLEITVDGVGFMENIDPAEAQSVLSNGGSLTVAEEATPTQPTDSVVFAQTQASVSIGPDFAFNGEPAVQDGIESIQIQGHTTQSIVAVGQTGSDVDDVLNSFSTGITSVYAETEIVEEGTGIDSAWRILWIPKEDEPATYMLIVVDTTIVSGAELMHAHELPADNVIGSIVTIQDQVLVNDQNLMIDLDLEHLTEVINEHSSGRETLEPSDPIDQTGQDNGPGEVPDDPREGARLPEDIDDGVVEDDGAENTTETGDTPGETPEATAETPATDTSGLPGTLTDSSWEGGVHNHLIEWDAATWFVETDFEGDLVSDHEHQEDTIVLQSLTPAGTVWLFVSVYGDDDTTPQEYLDHWISADFLTIFTDSGAEVEIVDYRTRGDNSAVLYLVTADSGEEYFAVRQAVTLENGSTLVVTLDSPVASMFDMYEIAQDVTIDGEPLLRVFSPSQIQRIIGD